MKNIVLMLFCGLATFSASAQNRNYANIDEKVAALGALADKNVATIADTITNLFSDKEDMARAIFYWIANNISLDPKTTRNQDQRYILPEEVIKNRKATPLGFSKLYQEMASDAGIRCLAIDGKIKFNFQEINEPADEPNYSWNVVQLGQSPEQWFYVDAASAAGFLDDKQNAFTKKFTSKYFFADKTLFNLTHFADNIAWQLGQSPKTEKEFYALPVIKTAAYELGVQKITPATGYTKTKVNKQVDFKINYGGRQIKTVSLLIGEGKKITKPEAMNFKAEGGVISFSYVFKKEDTMPVKIIVDDEILAEYMFEVVE